MALIPRIKARLAGLLASAEDPRQGAATVYDRHAELLRRLDSALTEIATSRIQVERQALKLREAHDQLREQARAALRAGGDDRARSILERRQTAARELERLGAQLAEIVGEEERLALARHRLGAQMEALRARQEIISARYTAAEAQVRISEALTGVSDDLAGLAAALERTEARAEHLQTRAAAMDDLFGDALNAGGQPAADRVEQELARSDDERAIEAEMEALRHEIGDEE